MKQTTVLMLIAFTYLAGGIGAQEVLTITPNGNVGINNASPEVQLEVVGNSELTGNLVVTGPVTVTETMTVNGTITTTTAIAAPNLVFTETVLLA